MGVLPGYCTAVEDSSLVLRSNLFEEMSAGADCSETLTSFGYDGSSAEKYDPLSNELTNEAICSEFSDEIATLQSVGNYSVEDALRFSYEISFTSDSDAQEYNTYISCIEMNAREDPHASCMAVMNSHPD